MSLKAQGKEVPSLRLLWPGEKAGAQIQHKLAILPHQESRQVKFTERRHTESPQRLRPELWTLDYIPIFLPLTILLDVYFIFMYFLNWGGGVPPRFIQDLLLTLAQRSLL